MVQQPLKQFIYDQVEIGEELGSYEYLLTQEMLDNFRASISDPDGVLVTACGCPAHAGIDR